MNRIQAADLEFDLDTEIESKLPTEVSTLLEELTNVAHLKEIVRKSILGTNLM